MVLLRAGMIGASLSAARRATRGPPGTITTLFARSLHRSAVAFACGLIALTGLAGGCGSSDDAASTAPQASTTGTTGVVLLSERPARRAAAGSEAPIPGIVHLRSREQMRQWLADHAGVPAVIVFGASWCTPCVSFNEAVTRYIATEGPRMLGGNPADFAVRTAYGDVDNGLPVPGNGIPIAVRYENGRDTGMYLRGNTVRYDRFYDRLNELYG